MEGKRQGRSADRHTKIHILEDLKQPVISKATQVKLGMLPVNYPHKRIHSLSTEAPRPPSEETKQRDLAAMIAEFPRVFDGVCRPMTGEPCKLIVRDGSIPVRAGRARQVPEPLLPATIAELELQISQGLLRRVDHPTPWIHGMVVQAKKLPTPDSTSGIVQSPGVRIAVDFRELNKCLVTTCFPNATPFQAVR